MSTRIKVSRRVVVPVLMVVLLLIVLVAANSGAGAQGLCEYATYTTVCIRPLGIIRVVPNANACTDREVAAFLVNQEKFECVSAAMGDALFSEADARIAADAALEAQIDALEARIADLEAP